jgi:hypothetical protein
LETFPVFDTNETRERQISHEIWYRVKRGIVDCCSLNGTSRCIHVCLPM